MHKKNIVNIFSLFFLQLSVLLFNSCLKEDDLVNFSIERDNSAELLTHIETNGNYFNSISCPALISAEVLNSKSGEYLVIDIRSTSEFNKGRISNAVRVDKNNLITFLKNRNTNLEQKIVLISATGQAASFCAAGLNIIGYRNVVALKYGMASWNSQFASNWLSVMSGAMPGNLNNTNNPKPDLSKLPEISFPPGLKTIHEKIEYQVQKIISEEFIDEVDPSKLIAKQNYYFSNGATSEFLDSFFIICSGPASLYFEYPTRFTDIPSHLPSAVFYQHEYPNYFLKSNSFLQTIPSTNKPILIYSTDGHLSAELTMYLGVLGYKAYSILFGLNYIYYDKAIRNGYGFTSSEIKEYPFIK
jgi:rhodanese-related sulfurtransferase